MTAQSSLSAHHTGENPHIEKYTSARYSESLFKLRSVMSSSIAIQVFFAVIGLSSGFSFSSLPSAPTVPYYNQGLPQQQQQQQNFYHHHHPHYHQNFYQSRALNNYQPSLDKPIFYPQLGMSPEYHNLVYKYITQFAGNEQPPHVKVADFGLHGNPEKEEGTHQANKDVEGIHTDATVGTPAGVKEYFRPSDFILLGKNPQTEMDLVKTRKMNFKENPLTNPPLGGVMSNYVLLRNRPDFQNFIPFSGREDGQVSKRQIGQTDEDDTVVINAENIHNSKMNEEEEDRKDQGMNEAGGGDEEADGEPAIAQSKPAAIALAGPGGVAQASPVGTALVGPGGFAVAAPSGTAVAGPAGIPPIAGKKDKLLKKKLKDVLDQ